MTNSNTTEAYQFTKEDIFNYLDTTTWECTLLPRYLYETFNEDALIRFKELLSGVYTVNEKSLFTLSKTIKIDKYYKHILESYLRSVFDPYTGNPSYEGYMKETLSDPIEKMFYMKAPITYNDFHETLYSRFEIQSIQFDSMNNDEITIVIVIDDVFM